MREVQDEKDRRLEDALFMWSADSEEYRNYRDKVVAPWYANAKISLEAMYFGYKQGQQGPTKLRKRPGSEDLLREMLLIGTEGTAQNIAGKKMNTELVLALEEIARWWDQNNQIAAMHGHDASWWYSSEAVSDPTTAMMRSNFQSRVYALTAKIEDNEVKNRVKWYTDAVVTPLMQGYDLDTPFIVDVDPLLAPEV